MSDPQGSNRSALAALVVAMGSVFTIVANLSGISQLQTAPTVIIVAVLALAAFILGLQAFASRKAQGGLTVWLAGGAILCAAIAVTVLLVSTTKGESSAGAQPSPTAPTHTSQSKPQEATSSLPEQPTSKPVADVELQLRLNNGSDVDEAKPNVVTAEAAAGKTDVALKYYGNLHAAGKGFYAVTASDDPEAACRAAVGALHAEEEVFSVAGAEYCLRTSSGNIAWVQVVKSSTTAFDPAGRSATLAIKVWPK